MLAKQIICNVIMFSAYIANMTWMIYTLVKMATSLPCLAEESKTLTDVEAYNLYQKHFFMKFVKMLLYNLVCLIIVAVARSFDGLVDPNETYLIVPGSIVVFGTIIFTLLFWGYTIILKKIYHIPTRHSQMRIGHNDTMTGVMASQMFMSIFLAFSTGLVVYTIVLLFV